MTMNAEKGPVLTGPSQEVLDIGGDVQTDAIVTPVARPVPVQTSGRLEFAARCPECRNWHRHVGLGERRAPCGTRYRLEFKGAA
ncbi:hypothetical protein [Streptomyces sp. C1-2]|uniref:hypothetical protein n=1 Tax=Streptomyces sp. C1-2 TaxID=2720022 RepID=UPI0014326DD7|nr:hypothetical protein [Streptomyces sp. C1-2]NJP73804.1 hypothetical protein [Streptomyces sp. C1-2]